MWAQTGAKLKRSSESPIDPGPNGANEEMLIILGLTLQPNDEAATGAEGARCLRQPMVGSIPRVNAMTYT